jgi:hypothetical protein
MEHNLTCLTFLEDPDMDRAPSGDLCVQVPAGITSAQDLLEMLQEQLGFPSLRREAGRRMPLTNSPTNWEMVFISLLLEDTPYPSEHI